MEERHKELGRVKLGMANDQRGVLLEVQENISVCVCVVKCMFDYLSSCLVQRTSPSTS